MSSLLDRAEFEKSVQRFLAGKLSQTSIDQLLIQRDRASSNATAVSTVDESISALVRQMNAVRSKKGQFSALPYDPARRYQEFLNGPGHTAWVEKAARLVLDGHAAFQLFFAGAATRLGKGPMYMLDPVSLDREPAGTPLSAARTGHGLGPRQLRQLRFLIEKLARERGADPLQALSRVPFIIHVNQDIWEYVRKDMAAQSFYGFNPDRIFFIIQPAYPLFEWKEGELVADLKTHPLPLGHGDSVQQVFQENQAATLSSDGKVNPVSGSLDRVLEKLGANLLLARRINDLTMLTRAALDLDRIAFGLEQFEQGNAFVAELVSNPHRQKGGNALYDHSAGKAVLMETANSAGSPELNSVVQTLTEQGAPYNKFNVLYSLTQCRAAFKEGLQPNVRYVEGHFTVELVTGDVTRHPGVNAAFFQASPKETTHDFKALSDLPEALSFCSDQDTNLI